MVRTKNALSVEQVLKVMVAKNINVTPSFGVLVEECCPVLVTFLWAQFSQLIQQIWIHSAVWKARIFEVEQPIAEGSTPS